VSSDTSSPAEKSERWRRIVVDGGTDTTFDSRDCLPSAAVVEAVAEASGTEPLALPPLYDAIDPDALDALFGPSSGGTQSTVGTIEFVYAGTTVELSDAEGG
jgi:hypothetical protein